MFPEMDCAILRGVTEWSFLTNHARVLLCIAHDPGARLRDISASLGITERTAHGIIADLAGAGYVVKQRDGRRNRYRIEANLPLREPGSREPAIGEVLAVLLGNTDGLAGLAGLAAAGRIGGGPADGADVITSSADGPGVPDGPDSDDAPGGSRPADPSDGSLRP
jgi:MarR family protein